MTRADKLIETAVGYVGYLEKATNGSLDDPTANPGSGNWTIFGRWYELNGYPWCAMFVSYCAAHANIPASVIPKHASCIVGVEWFKANGRFHPHGDYRPVPGDLVYFTHDGRSPAHVGIVTKADHNSIETVEGNTSAGPGVVSNGGAVALKCYALTADGILGYGHPDYTKEETDMTLDEIRYGLTSVGATGAGHSSWASDAITMMSEAGIVNGDGDGNFGWGQCLTREGAAQILYNLLERLDLLDQLKEGVS